MYKLTIEAKTLEELISITSLLSSSNSEIVSSLNNSKPLKEITVRKKKELKKEETVSPISSEPEKDDLSIEEKKSDVTYEQVSKATLELVKAKGKPVVLEVLEQFGAKSAQTLKPEQWPEYLEAASAKLARL